MIVAGLLSVMAHAATVHIHCADCDEAFTFMGVPGFSVRSRD